MNAYFAVRLKPLGDLDWCVNRFLPAFYSNFEPGEKLVFYEECHSSTLAFQLADEFAQLSRDEQVSRIQTQNPGLENLLPDIHIKHVVAGYVSLGVSDGFARRLYDLMAEMLLKSPDLSIEYVEETAMKIIFEVDDDDKSGGIGCRLPDWPKPPRQFGDFKQFPCLQS